MDQEKSSSATEEQFTLTRDERAEVLGRCLNNHRLIRRCHAVAAVLDTGPEDVVNTVGIKIYEGLFYYRLLKPEQEPQEMAYRMGINIGHNCVTDMVRKKLRKKNYAVPSGFAAAELPEAGLNDVTITEICDCMVAVAVKMVGAARAGHLMRAMLYDWDRRRNRPLTEPQRQVMHALGLRQRLQVAQLLAQYYQALRRQVDVPRTLMKKEEGIWRVIASNLN